MGCGFEGAAPDRRDDAERKEQRAEAQPEEEGGAVVATHEGVDCAWSKGGEEGAERDGRNESGELVVIGEMGARKGVICLQGVARGGAWIHGIGRGVWTVSDLWRVWAAAWALTLREALDGGRGALRVVGDVPLGGLRHVPNACAGRQRHLGTRHLLHE